MKIIHIHSGEAHTMRSPQEDAHITLDADANLTMLIKNENAPHAACTIDCSQNSKCRIVHIANAIRRDSWQHSITINLAQEYACFEYFGLCHAAANANCSVNVEVFHLVPNCNSSQLFKAIAADDADIHFRGKITAAHGAAQTNAQQTCKGLLLSHAARIAAMPQLEIYTDDVKCTHGAAIGHLDEQAMFYLRSRGIADEQAQQMLLQAFAWEILEKEPKI